MEKQAVIKELREKQVLWNKIVSLTTQCTNVAMKKAEAVDQKESEVKRKYHYNPSIKISKTLPTDNEQAVQDDISYRHSGECLKAAKKKLGKLRVLSLLFMVVALAITLFPHISNFANNDMTAYANFSGSIDYEFRSDAFGDSTDLAQNITYVVLAIFSMACQVAMMFFARLAVFSIAKSSASNRVPSIGGSKKGLWIALTCVVGIFALFTWISATPIGILSLVPYVLLLIISLSSVSKLAYSSMPVPTPEEDEKLRIAKAEDAENHAKNESARKAANEKAQKLFNESQRNNVEAYTKAIEQYDQEIEQLTDDIAALMKQAPSEILSKKDNNLNTINSLLNYLENGRADTLKEALYMVDMEKEREKDRETQRQIAQMQMENDRFMAQLEYNETKRYNDEMLAQQRAHNERIQREQSRHNAEVESHNREMEKELERIKREHNL